MTAPVDDAGRVVLTEAERRMVLSRVPLAHGSGDEIVAAVEHFLTDRLAAETARADAAEAEVDRFREELDEHRAHYVDPVEHAQVVEALGRVRALAELCATAIEPDGSPSMVSVTWVARALRAALDAAPGTAAGDAQWGAAGTIEAMGGRSERCSEFGCHPIGGHAAAARERAEREAALRAMAPDQYSAEDF